MENIINEEAEKFEQARVRYENLAYAVKSPEGQKVLQEVLFLLDEVKSGLYNVAMSNIPFPYEYSKEELQRQKQLRSQLEVLNQLATRLDYEQCMALAMNYKEKYSKVLAGEPTEAVY